MLFNYLISTAIILLILTMVRVNYLNYKIKEHYKSYKIKYEMLLPEHEKIHEDLNNLSQMISKLRAENDTISGKLFYYEYVENKGL